MFSNTGTISLFLYGIFIFITIIAMIFAFYQIKKGSIEMSKLDKMIELFKYAIVSTAIATVSLVVADLFKEREQDIKELEYFDKYVEDVKKADGIEARLQLSKYLSIVAPSGEMKKSWKSYYDTVKVEYKEYQDLKSKQQQLDTIRDPSPKQRLESKQAHEELSKYEKPLATSSTSSKKPLIYIQYCNTEIKEEIIQIQQLFNNRFWNAPGIEYLESGCDNSIRYFHEEDRVLANEANSLLDNKFRVLRSRLSAPKGQIELWVKN